MATITQRYIERDGLRILWRIAIDDVVALDVLTDAGTLESACRTIEEAPARGLTEHRLGTFGEFEVTVSTTDDTNATISIDGPHLDNAFQGWQSVVFYLERTSLLNALRLA
jgi:hypothetical protein